MREIRTRMLRCATETATPSNAVTFTASRCFELLPLLSHRAHSTSSSVACSALSSSSVIISIDDRHSIMSCNDNQNHLVRPG